MPETSPGAAVGAAVVTVGDELLLGRTVDTNAAWLGRELADLGIPVVRRHTVADEDGEIRGAVSDALQVAELVLVGGGLGPTPDDRTRDAVASLLGRPLEEDPEVLERIRARYAERGIEKVPSSNRRLAQVPRGARKLANPQGTAPGLAMEADGRLVVLLPGIPRELKAVFTADLVDALRAHFRGRLKPVHIRSIRTTGIPESLLGQRIGERLAGDGVPIRVAYLPDERGVDVRLTAVGMDADEAERRLDDIEDRLADVLAPWRFEAAEGDLVEAVTAALRADGRTLAVAESCTGGLVAKRMTDLAGSSDVFRGGVVAYANDVKVEQLGVDPADLAEQGAVSEVVARRMAEGVARRFQADAGIGITGIAGPGGGTEEKPVGTVWYAAAAGGTVVARGERFPGDRRSVRERAAQAALFLLLRLLEGRAAP